MNMDAYSIGYIVGSVIGLVAMIGVCFGSYRHPHWFFKTCAVIFALILMIGFAETFLQPEETVTYSTEYRT